MELLKTVRVSNPHNTLVQVPKYIAEQWGLQKGDSIQMYLNEGKIVLEPKRGYFKVRKIEED